MGWCLLLFASLASAQFFDLQQKYSSKVAPCDDFTKYVCASDENKVDALFKVQHWDEFATKIRPLVYAYSDPGMERIKKILFAQKENYYLSEMGKKVGRSAAQNMHPDITVDSTEFGPTKTVRVTVDERLSVRRPTEECILKYCPAYIQGIVVGYKSEIDLKSRINSKTVVNYSKQIKFPSVEVPEKEKVEIFDYFFNEKFSAYANAVTAKLAVEHKIYLSEEGRRRAETMNQEIRAAVAKKFRSLKWLSNSEQIAKHVESIRVIYGIAQEFIEHPEYIDEMLAFYENEVQRNFEHEKRNKGCKDLTCEMDVLKQVYIMAAKRYTNIHPERENFSNLMIRETFEPFSMNTFGGYNPNLGVLTIHPETILLLNNLALPDGLIYGTVGTIMAHELHHAIDFGQNGGVMDIYQQDPRGERARQCLSDFYGSFPIVQGGQVIFENGSMKIDEGFADLEGSRTVLKILTDRRASFGRKKRETSVSSFSDVEWFFFGLAKIACFHLGDDKQAFEASRFEYHPRMNIRFNAVLLQMPEFSKYFRCRPGDNMFRVERLCEPFPLD
uniref:Peptidase_M13 domain-containing protein n=1 Tax=Steinernema glaseri TaxID=37863 RepID=A0A1I7YPE3_9BILA